MFGTNPYVAKRDIVGEVVAVLRGMSEMRGLDIATYRSRAVVAGHVHELMVTDENAVLNSVVNRVGLIAFFEIGQSGVILVGDVVEIDGHPVGSVAGFNDTHMPNHQNICLRSDRVFDGESRSLRVGAGVRIYHLS